VRRWGYRSDESAIVFVAGLVILAAVALGVVITILGRG
jgi:hypothetical protein